MRIPSRAVVQLLALAILAVGFLSSGCGSDDNPAAPAGPTSVGGNVNKAPIAGAAVNIHTINTNGSIGAFVAGPFTTGATGDWSGTIPAGSVGPYVMVSTGGSYTDEATGTLVTLASGRALAGVFQGTSSAVTPLTHATFFAIQAMVTGGTPLATAITQATNSSTTAFGLSFTTTTPLNAPTATADQKEYAGLLGGISTLLDSNPALSAFTNTDPVDLVIALAKDMPDGQLDGLDALGSAIDVPTDPAATSTAPLPALSATDLSAWLTAANTYCLGEPNLAGTTFDVNTAWGPANPPPGGGGPVTFSGPGSTQLPSNTFTPSTSDIPAAEQYRWNDNVNHVEILIVLADQGPYPGKVQTLYVVYNGVSPALIWNEFNGTGISDISFAGGKTTFTNVVVDQFTGGTSPLTLNGELTNAVSPTPPPATLHFSGTATGTGPLGTITEFTPDFSFSYQGDLYWTDSTNDIGITVTPASATDVATISVSYAGTLPATVWMVDNSSGPTGATFSGGQTIFAGSNLNEQGGSTVLTLNGSLENPAMTP